MPVIEGAVIGAVVGATASVVFLLRRQKKRGDVLASLHQGGPEAARAVIDAQAPALDKIGLSKILDQRERMAALALIGDVAALEREIAAHTGSVTAVAQVNAAAMLGMAVRGDPAVAADMLARLAAWTEHEGGRAIALVKKKVRAQATLAAAVAGAPMPDQAWPAVLALGREGGLFELVAARAIAIAFARAGNPAAAAEWDGRVRARTPAFD